MYAPHVSLKPMWSDPPPRPCPTLRRLLRLAGARPQDKVCVTGPQGLAALLSLCHLGFAQACCLDGGACACSDMPCDVLLVTGPLDGEALSAALAHALPRLKDGGVLAVHEADLEDDRVILQALKASGRLAGWRVHDMAGGGCLVALEVRRARRPQALAAA
jgi:hypothetical protein